MRRQTVNLGSTSASVSGNKRMTTQRRDVRAEGGPPQRVASKMSMCRYNPQVDSGFESGGGPDKTRDDAVFSFSSIKVPKADSQSNPTDLVQRKEVATAIAKLLHSSLDKLNSVSQSTWDELSVHPAFTKSEFGGQSLFDFIPGLNYQSREVTASMFARTFDSPEHAPTKSELDSLLGLLTETFG